MGEINLNAIEQEGARQRRVVQSVREEELSVKLQELQAELDSIKGILEKAKKLLLQWNPKDEWFPQIEYQFSKFIEKIEQALRPEQEEGKAK